MSNTIAQNLIRLQNAKYAIANAITAKGGAVTTGDGFEDFASDIATIPSGQPSYVSSGLQFISTELTGARQGTQGKIAAADYSSGYTLEVAFIATSAPPNTYGRLFEIRESSSSNAATKSDLIALDTNKYELIINGSWEHSSDFEVSISYNELVTATLVVNSDQTALLYHNGVLAQTFNSIGSIPSSRNNGVYWYIGCGSVASRTINGTIHSVRLYNRALTANEIAANRAIDVTEFGS